jgi:preprotein translocase subunit SecB
MMTEKYKILAKYIKDSSSETPDLETYLFVKENISKYKLKIDIKTKPLKNALLEENITFTYKDDDTNEKKSFYEITYAIIVKINDGIKEKKDLEKIILCDIPNSIYPELEKSFLNLIHNSGHPNLEFGKKIDFNKLFNERFS